MTTLDGVERPLQEGDVVIADGRGAVALAGVMGGATSEVSETTTAVLLEAATFDPRSVRRTAKRLGLHSEASHRFERSVDANGIPHAALRAAAMIARLGGGVVNGEPVDRYPMQQHPRRVTLSLAGLTRTAGFDIPLAQAAEKLTSIDISADVAGDALTAIVPTFRPDISIEPDLIEEVMRLTGYDRVPARLPPGTRAPSASPEALADRARDVLAAQGLHEAVTWGFVPRPWLEALGKARRNGAPLGDGIAVKNPISSDYEVMRTSLFPGLAEAARRNLMRGVPDVALFEVGPVVLRGADAKEHPTEPTIAAGILLGRRPEWLKPGDAVRLLRRQAHRRRAAARARHRRAQLSRAPAATNPIVHPGSRRGSSPGPQGTGREVGLVGEVHPAQRKRFGLGDGALYFEVELDAVAGERRAPASVSPPRFPAATRDVSFWIADAITADEQRAAMTAAAEPLLRELAVLEDFRDPRYVAPGKKGMLWTMTYRAADRTLTDAEVDAAHARVVSALGAAHTIAFADSALRNLEIAFRAKGFTNSLTAKAYSGYSSWAMTKADIVENVYEKVGGFSKKEAAEIVETVFDTIKETLERGEKIKISGFGNFVVRDKNARAGTKSADRTGDHDQRASRADVQAEPGAEERTQRVIRGTRDFWRDELPSRPTHPGSQTSRFSRSAKPRGCARSSPTCCATGRPSSARSARRRRGRSSGSTSARTSSCCCASGICSTTSASRSRARARACASWARRRRRRRRRCPSPRSIVSWRARSSRGWST